MLRETRERYGLTLRDVANALRIRVVYLHALEEGRFVDLPGQPYVVGFLRSYAEYFSLDGEEVVRRYREERSDTGRPAKLVFPEPPPESKFPLGAMLAILVVVSVLGYGAWQFIGGSASETRPMVASVPTEMALEADHIADAADQMDSSSAIPHAMDGARVAAVDQTTTTTTTTRSLAGAVAQDDGPVDEIAAPLPAETADSGVLGLELSSASAASISGYDDPAYASDYLAEDPALGMPTGQAVSPSSLGFPNAGETVVPDDLAALGLMPDAATNQNAVATVSAIESAATQVYGDVSTESRVLLRATEDCWIQVNDNNGSDVFTRLLKAGEVYRVPNRDDLLLRMGNAGGLEVIVDGTTLPLLGGHGEVMRNVSLAPDSLLSSL